MTSLLQLERFHPHFLSISFVNLFMINWSGGGGMGGGWAAFVKGTLVWRKKNVRRILLWIYIFGLMKKKGALIYVRTYKECINGWKFLTSKNRSFDKFLTNKSLECVGNNQLVNEGYLPGIPKPCWLPQLLEKFFCFRKKVVKSKAFIHFSSTSSSITKKSKRLH